MPSVMQKQRKKSVGWRHLNLRLRFHPGHDQTIIISAIIGGARTLVVWCEVLPTTFCLRESIHWIWKLSLYLFERSTNLFNRSSQSTLHSSWRSRRAKFIKSLTREQNNKKWHSIKAIDSIWGKDYTKRPKSSSNFAITDRQERIYRPPPTIALVHMQRHRKCQKRNTLQNEKTQKER